MHIGKQHVDDGTTSARALKLRFCILLVLITLAFSTRALPISMSSYPFNNDGMTECRIASDILETGSLAFPESSYYAGTHSVITPAFNVLIAYAAAYTGATPYEAGQILTASISLLTVVGVYLVSLEITRDRRGAIAAAFTVGFFGTFVFLTGSTWKAAIGVALLVFLVYLHMNRHDRRLQILSIVVLFAFPFVHHLVALIAYLGIAYATGISFVSATVDRRLRKAHWVDLGIITIVSGVAFIYYSVAPLDRLSSVVTEMGFILMIVVFLGVLMSAVIVLRREGRLRFSFAPIPALAVFGLFALDFFRPIFPYTSGYPQSLLLLGAVTSVIVGIAWHGFWQLLITRQRLRAVPIAWLLPVLTLIVYALMSGATLSSHQIIYRSFDFADIALALGVSATVAGYRFRPKAQKRVLALVGVVILISFPYGYMTNTLEGIRHDTQQYEVDALEWIYYHEGADAVIQADERISYNARALFDFVKRPYVPDYLLEVRFPSENSLNVFLEEWSTVGVNDYPEGHPIIDEAVVGVVLLSSSTLYIGGPSTNSIIVYRSSSLGQSEVFA